MDKQRLAMELVRLAREVMGMEFPSQKALRRYIQDHPDADKSKHTVKKPGTKGKTHPATATIEQLVSMGQTTAGFKKALKEQAGTDDKESLREVAKEFSKAAKSRKKGLEKNIINFMKKNGQKDMSVQALFKMSNNDNLSEAVKKRADSLHHAYTSLGNISQMADEV